MKENQTIINGVLVTRKKSNPSLLNSTLAIATDLASKLRYRTDSQFRDVSITGQENVSYVRLFNDTEAYLSPAFPNKLRFKPVQDHANNCIHKKITGEDAHNRLKNLFEGMLDAKGIEFTRKGAGKKRSVEIDYSGTAEDVENVIAVFNVFAEAMAQFRAEAELV
jgi:hypothetical protein